MFKAQIEGRVTADPELRFTPAGLAVATANVAVNHRKREASGEWVDDGTTWVRASLFGKKAENFVEHVRKGQLVRLEGQVKNREWTNAQGEKKLSLELAADAWFLIPRDPGSSQAAQTQGFGAPNSSEPPF